MEKSLANLVRTLEKGVKVLEKIEKDLLSIRMVLMEVREDQIELLQKGGKEEMKPDNDT